MNTSGFSPSLRSPLFIAEADNDIRCELCPNYCSIKSGGFGLCGARGNKGGRGIIPFYGFVSAAAVDPIEKKPLYHFKPGSSIFSIGFVGCNLRCPFCQNWHISQNTDAAGRWLKPNEIITYALRQETLSIAYTYSESLVHIEYMLDCMMLARRHGIFNVLVTNGCVNNKAAASVLKLTDAINVDLKCFSEKTYKECLGGNLQTTLEFIELADKLQVHTEITTLIVPGLNDSEKELSAITDYIASVNKEIPWHLSAYRPEYRWNAPPTNPNFLLNTAVKAREKLSFVYTGNIAADNDTHCTICGAALIKRCGYTTDVSGIINNCCATCGKTPRIVL